MRLSKPNRKRMSIDWKQTRNALPHLPNFNDVQARHAENWLRLMGTFPAEQVSPDPVVREAPPIEGVPRFHVAFASESDDHVTGWLLVPESPKPAPSVICLHSTTGGSGKDRIVGLCGEFPGSPPDCDVQSRAYGLELAKRGFVTLSIDFMGDGERFPDGLQRYDTTRFYEQHPDWSAVGKNLWDTVRALDFLETLDFIDPDRIGCMGHSLGGHSTLFAAAFDSRIKVSVSNCGALSWQLPAEHWSRKPKPGSGPVESYIYLPKFRRYIDSPHLVPPVDFEHLMMLIAPRPLLVMTSVEEDAEQQSTRKVEAACAFAETNCQKPSNESFTFPGGHHFPPEARKRAYTWFERWL